MPGSPPVRRSPGRSEQRAPPARDACGIAVPGAFCHAWVRAGDQRLPSPVEGGSDASPPANRGKDERTAMPASGPHTPATPLTALLLSDGKPGHHRQAEGGLAAMARLRPTTTARREVRRRSMIPTPALIESVTLGLAPAAILRLGYGIGPAVLPRADVVVSAGGETLAANVAAARLLAAPNVFAGRLRRLAPERVSVILVALERLATHPNHVVCLPPSPVEARPHTGSTAPWGRSNPPRRVGVLIGGNSGTFRYRSADWRRLTEFLGDAHRAAGIHWLATTSRRSGAAVAGALAALSREESTGIDTFIDYRTSGP